jgi:hypothetical protein
VVYQVRVRRLVPVPEVDVCLTRRVPVAHFLTRCGRVARAVFKERWRTVSRRPDTVSGSGGVCPAAAPPLSSAATT